jgi:hypothetical protein
MWMGTQPVPKEAFEQAAHPLDVIHQILLADDALDLKGGGTGDRMSLVRLAMGEGPRPAPQHVNDALADEQGRHRGISTTQSLPNRLEIRGHVFLLPSMKGAGPAHATHNLVEDEQGAMLAADVLHGAQVAGETGHTAQSLGP